MKPLGPPDAPIAIICDYPSPADRSAGFPLSDHSSQLFWRIASDKGILKNSCFIDTVLQRTLPAKPELLKVAMKALLYKGKRCPGPGWEKEKDFWISPELLEQRKRILQTLELVRPRIVIAMGDLALWALTTNIGILKWRGSRIALPQHPFQVVPCLPSRGLQKDITLSNYFQIDLGRAKNIFEGKQLPRNYRFEVAPSAEQACQRLDALLQQSSEQENSLIAADIETRGGHITCLGLAWSPEEAICFPLITTNDEKTFFYTEEEEAEILYRCAKLFTQPSVSTIGQNFLYDAQYMYRHWGFVPTNVVDTMIGNHSIFAPLRKNLGFLSSMYAQDHVYWKDDIDDWDPALGERQYWEYNCRDNCVTWEIWPEILKMLESCNV